MIGIAVDDHEADERYEARMATLWPIDDDDLIVGEDTYTGGDGSAGIENRKIT